MTIDNTIEPTTGTDSRASVSRRFILGSVAATSALASLPTSAFGRQDDTVGDLETVAEFEPPPHCRRISRSTSGEPST